MSSCLPTCGFGSLSLSRSQFFQGWDLRLPAHITRVVHITRFSEAEFVSLCSPADGGENLASAFGLCWRMAQWVAASEASRANTGVVNTVTTTCSQTIS